MGANLSLQEVQILYGNKTIVSDLSLELKAGEIGCLLGASASGKTSILRAIAGFEPIAQGCIRLKDRTISTPKRCAAPENRGIGMVFQHFALFPHLDVQDNIAFGLNRLSRTERKQRVSGMLNLLSLETLAGCSIHKLSGGQRQRVAIARALAPNPNLLLLDEPFSHLDRMSRRELAEKLHAVFKHENTTVLWVTHDQTEAFMCADKIGFIAQKRLQQWDCPKAIYHQPANVSVAKAIGHGSRIRATRLSNNLIETELGLATCCNQSVAEITQCFIRPEQIILDNTSQIRGTVVKLTELFSEVIYHIKLPSGEGVHCKTSSSTRVNPGDLVGIKFISDKISLPVY